MNEIHAFIEALATSREQIVARELLDYLLDCLIAIGNKNINYKANVFYKKIHRRLTDHNRTRLTNKKVINNII